MRAKKPIQPALDSIREANECFELLVARLRTEQGDSADHYIRALEEASELTGQLAEFLELHAMTLG